MPDLQFILMVSEFDVSSSINAALLIEFRQRRDSASSNPKGLQRLPVQAAH